MPIGLFALCIGAVSLFAISGRSILASASGSLLNPMGMTDSLKVGSIGGVAASLVLAALVVKSGHSGLGPHAVFHRHGRHCRPLMVQAGRHGRRTCRGALVIHRADGLGTGRFQ